MKRREERLGRFTYRWDEDCFPLGADSLALGEFVTLRPRERVVDLGCGAGLLLLLCARREEGLDLTGVEVDPHAAGLARENLERNGLSGQICQADLRSSGLPPGQAHLVITNPPWYPPGFSGGSTHVETASLEELCREGARLLRHKGRMALVHRPERLVELFAACRQAGLEPKRMKLCRHSPEKHPYAVCVEAVKGGRCGLQIL